MALQKTAKMKEKEYPQASSMILNNTYVDDIITSVKDRDEANNLVRQTNHNTESRCICSETLDNIRLWWSLNEKPDQLVSSGEIS